MSNLIVQRPDNIFSLFASLNNLNGVGEKKLKLLEQTLTIKLKNGFLMILKKYVEQIFQKRNILKI